jgi:hypothetical protein
MKRLRLGLYQIFSSRTVAAAGKVISEAHRIRRQCIDQRRSEATVCTTKCKDEDCLEGCTEPLATCIDDCRAKYPREAK